MSSPSSTVPSVPLIARGTLARGTSTTSVARGTSTTPFARGTSTVPVVTIVFFA